jgi:hypothetical protein
MSNRLSPKSVVHNRTMEKTRKLSVQKNLARMVLCMGAVVLTVVMLFSIFGGAILNGYGKRKAERAFAQAHPGCALHIGDLQYAVGANRLILQSVTLSNTRTRLKVGRISLTGVRWARLLWGTALADVLAKASLEATNLDVEFPRAHYELRCGRLRTSVPGSELLAEGTELRTLLGDEEFFAAHAFRTTRFHVVVPECRVSGLAYNELLRGTAYRARSVHFSQPSLDALVDCDKPVAPFVESPLMVHEALAAILQPMQVDSISITNGLMKYSERMVAAADPGVLTFAAVNMSVEGIANRGEAPAAILIHAQGDFMNAGTLKVLMSIPIRPPDFSMHYSGSLGAMDMTRLDPFLDIAEYTRIKSGNAQEAVFEIDVSAGHARGHVRAIYTDLEIARLGKQTGTEKGLANRAASFLANEFEIRKSNGPDASGGMKEGEVNYTRRPSDEFQQFVWFALRTGVLNVISQ